MGYRMAVAYGAYCRVSHVFIGYYTIVTELKQWKERIDDIVSPTQLGEMKQEVRELKDFKLKAIAGFTVIQFLMGLVLFYDKLM